MESRINLFNLCPMQNYWIFSTISPYNLSNLSISSFFVKKNFLL